MLLQFSIRVAKRPPVWEELFVSFVNIYQFVYVLLSLLGLRAGCGI